VQKRQPQQPLGWELQAEIDSALGDRKAAAAARRAALERGGSPERAVMLHRALLASEQRRFDAVLREHDEIAGMVSRFDADNRAASVLP